MEPDRELSLVERATKGDAVAITLLLKDSQRWLIAVIGHRIPADLRGLLDPEDVVQEAHVDVFRHASAFQWRGPGSFHRWTLKIALRRLRAAVRAQRAERRGGGKAAGAVGAARNHEDSVICLLDLVAALGRTPSWSAARVESVRAVHDVLATLLEHYRTVVELVYIEGLPVATAASSMVCTERAIHGYCRRGLKLLRDGLGSSSRFFSSSG